MKKIIYLIVAALALTSCKDILDLKPLDRISETSVWNDQSLIELYVTTNYHAVEHGFYQGGIWGGAISGEINSSSNASFVLQGSLTSDNVTSVDPSDSYLKIGTPPGLNYWKSAYSYIRNINVFFTKIDDAPIDIAVKNRLKGEMKFIRAFTYANLICRYGGVPIIDYVFALNDDFTKVSRASYDDCVNFIIKDLDDAIGLLPNQQTGALLGRVSGDAARALKSRVLLYAASPLNNPANDLAKWTKAATAAEALLNSGYALYNNYQNLFLPGAITSNKEIIFARYFTQANCHYTHFWCGRNADNAGGFANAPTQNMVDAYEMVNGELPYLENGSINSASGYDPQNPYVNRDPRFEASILHDGSVWRGRVTETFQGGIDSPGSSMSPWNASLTSYYLKKFVQPELIPAGDIKASSINSTSPYVFFRYAEILLNYAEAKFELGDEVNARKYINMIRSRSGVDMPPVTASGQELRKKIQNERRIELAFEGHRFFDVRRWKIATTTEIKNVMGMKIIKLGDGSKTYTPFQILERHFSDNLYLVPIARIEIDRSLGALKQNPGY
ncbi:MAG: RagB/SusD family nutrient uptake outer membrane protein [Lentimicrobiaceae bacterium]|nr:RagB/SusD family nutrient uptake outer membrane protein [Lentimicrobiaceae bacterium]